MAKTIKSQLKHKKQGKYKQMIFFLIQRIKIGFQTGF